MRALPAGWSDPSEKVQTTPTVYLHVLDSAWPPASTANDGTEIPVGWAQCGTWSIDCDLVAPLLPGQVTGQAGFASATASCTIPQPKGGLLAPWRSGAERTPTAGPVELWASFDGPTGGTAFLLGKFLLDPIKGKVSERSLSLALVQDTVRLRKPHDLPKDASGIFGPPFSPTALLEAGASNNGYTLNATADFDAELTSSYFPRKTNELDAMQQIVAANLGAMFLSMDGVTLNVLDPDYLLGAGAVLDTIDVAAHFDDLSWSQDPNAAVDRIELTYLPPEEDDTAMGPFPYDGAAIWFAPKGAKIPAHGSVRYDFDPGSAASNAHTAGNRYVYGNTAKDGTGTSADLPVDVDVLSSGSWSITIQNTEATTQYLMAPYFPPGGGSGTTDYSKNTRSFLAGTIDGATESTSQKTLTWGVATEDATNTLTIDLGRNIQTEADAQEILDRIVERISTPTYVIDDVQVVPNLGRELADLYRIELPEASFNTRAMVTGISTAGAPGSVTQSLTIAAMPLRLIDFDEAWDTAHPGATLDDFDAAWAGATIDDFDSDPLRAV